MHTTVQEYGLSVHNGVELVDVKHVNCVINSHVNATIRSWARPPRYDKQVTAALTLRLLTPFLSIRISGFVHCFVAT